MSRELLEIENKKFQNYLINNEITNAFIYQPGNSDSYWDRTNKRIGICNLETYGEASPGIKSVTSTLLDNWSDGNKTIRQSIFINYCIKHAFETNFKIETKDSIKKLHELTKPKNPEYYNMYEVMDKSLYFNFRHSVSNRRIANSQYIKKQYFENDFYCQHYRDFVDAAKLDVVVVSSKLGADLINRIYPEMHGNFAFQGEPIMVKETLFVSIHHPAFISYAEIADCVNKIGKVLQ